MRLRYIAAAIALLLFLLVSAYLLRRRRLHRLDSRHFMERWLSLQKFCASRKTWPDAISEADALLDEALKRSGFKGKTMGERLVSAQKALTNNESVWFGHKYSKRIPDEDVRRLRKQDMLEALHGFRQALRDIGALEVEEPPND